MVSKTYTARELLRLRQDSTSKTLYNKLYQRLNNDAAFGEIFRMSPERALPLIREEASDNVMGDSVSNEESSVRQLDGTDAEWKYRGRTESEHGEHHPIGAPAGLAAQKDEGFQRFYKAVVSPTHVRVTAGGRIVPNTRGSSSPTAKWARERVGGETSYIQRLAAQGLGDAPAYPIPAAPLSHQAYSAFPPLFPGFFPGMPATMAPGLPQPYPMAPWQMGFGMGHPFGAIQGSTPQTAGVKSASTTSGASATSDRQGDSVSSETSSSVRISPPENFDPSRPYYIAGQWVTPGSPPFYPYGMASLGGFPVGGPAMMQPRYAMGASVQPLQAKPERPTQMHTPAASSATSQSQPGYSTIPISSIRPSDITKKQIESLKSTLRYYEDQLQYNKHQIDEKSMESQADVVRDQIQQFEKTFQSQLEAEKSQYPRSEVTGDPNSSHLNDFGGGLAYQAAANNAKSIAAVRQSTVSQSATAHVLSTRFQAPHEQYTCRRSSTLKSVKSASAPVSAKITPESSDSTEPPKKSSTLPVSAALAPPFHPRTESTASVPAPLIAHKASDSSVEDAAFEHPVTKAHTRQSHSSESFIEKPYLIGRLPDGGIDAVNFTGYLYNRELTEDELRARHMYWGKAPLHLQKGLPKFDGKDFYPPSPVKSQPLSSVPSATPLGQLGHGESVDSAHKSSKVVADPFRSLGRATQRLSRNALGAATQSENLTGSDELSEDQSNNDQEGMPLGSGPSGSSYEEFRKALGNKGDSSEDHCKYNKSSDDDDNSNILFRGRKYMATNGKTRNEIWQSLWKRSKSSATVVPSTVTSMTARGVLPNYAGHATASLTPTIASASTSPIGSLPKLSPAEGNILSEVRHGKVENRPPLVAEGKEVI